MVETIQSYAVAYVPKVALAIAVLFGGFWLVKKLCGQLEKRLEVKGVDPTLRPFVLSLIRVGLKVLILISVISMLGVATTSFVAVIGAAGLAVGLALQGQLSNFAGGALILFLKPFVVGDFIEAQGVMGVVQAVRIFDTILLTPDNKTVHVPNGALSNGVLTNYSAQETRRVDFTFGIGYGDNIDKARSIIEDIAQKNDKVLKDPEPFIGLVELGDSSVNFAVRLWAKADDYWDVFFNTQEAVKIAFDKNNVSIPFPQMDVHTSK